MWFPLIRNSAHCLSGTNSEEGKKILVEHSGVWKILQYSNTSTPGVWKKKLEYTPKYFYVEFQTKFRLNNKIYFQGYCLRKKFSETSFSQSFVEILTND
jgi:hypothetical protein